MNEKTKFEISASLASDFAESIAEANAIESMRSDSAQIAKTIRQMSEENTNQRDPLVQEFESNRRAIRYALWYLLDGAHGYKLVKQNEPTV